VNPESKKLEAVEAGATSSSSVKQFRGGPHPYWTTRSPGLISGPPIARLSILRRSRHESAVRFIAYS